jgi:hypothetical protein
MNAQNCQGRLLFKKFKVEVSLDYKATMTTSDRRIEDNYAGTWKAGEIFTDFTKRELSCPKLLAAKKATLAEGWAHKNIDTAIRRDFSAGYPFPSMGQGQGYAPPPEYYADQPYDVAEAVPLIDQLRSRQPFIPLLNNLPITGPYYFKDKETDIPPNLDKEQFVLSPNETIFESQDDYQNWLAQYLPAAMPVYFPKAPNDPEPEADPRTVPTLFETKKKWTDFLKIAGGRGINCGGQAQCGINFNLTNPQNSTDHIQCSTSTTYSVPGAPDNTSGTAIIYGNPSVFSGRKISDVYTPDGGLYYDTYGRSIKKSDTLKQVDKFGNFLFNDWEKFPPTPLPDPLPIPDQFLYQFYDQFFLFEYFNNKQKGCGQLIDAISKIYKGKDVMPYQLYFPYQTGFEEMSEFFVPFAAGFMLYPFDFKTTITANDGLLIATSTASKSYDGPFLQRSAESTITYTITYEDR